jgi:unsaturated rhamnogalacturonyl hydrolase
MQDPRTPPTDRRTARLQRWVIALLCSWPLLATSAETFDIGLAGGVTRIDGMAVTARSRNAPTVVLVGGLKGDDATAVAVRAAVAAYDRRRDRPVHLLAVPVANPAGARLQFPPTGTAYREQGESHALWRWLGTQAPDLVLIAGEDDAGLAAALIKEKVADMGRIPARRWNCAPDWLNAVAITAPSEAHAERDRRLARTPHQYAVELAQFYGHDFDQPWYINALALIARVRLGDVDDVRRLAEPYVDGRKDPLARPNALVMAGQTLFTELALRTGDSRYLAAVTRTADLGFDAAGNLLEAMPYHDGYSDSVFMGTTILAQAGALTGERRYFDMAERHLRFMQKLDLRPDGLYRHQPQADAAWGRGNGFAAIGLALTLSEFPRDHAGYAHVLTSYRSLMDALLPLQNRDGLWRNVVNHPGTFAEFSGTAMIGFALKRGLARGWIKDRRYEQAVDRAWRAVNARTSSTGTFVDICESTARITVDQYLQRAAILGTDPRGGAMALLFATELME